jgi:hypothetical protein
MHDHEQQFEQQTGGRRRVGPAQSPPDVLAGPMSPAAMLALQRLAGNAAVARLRAHQVDEQAAVQRAVVRDALRSAERPLDDGVRAEMESRLDADFSDVRVHTDATAHSAAESVQAHAFTSGSHIVFQRGRYDTTSPAGKHMLAHELTHVTQQRSGPVAGTDTGDGLRVSDPSDRFERAAETNAARVMSAPAAAQRTVTEPSSPGAPGETVQRDVGFEIELPLTTTYAFAPGLKAAERSGQKQIVNPITSTTWEGRRANRPWWRPQNDPPSLGRRMNKSEQLVVVRNRFTVEADEMANGSSDLEFVTVPFPETDQGRAQLIDALAGIAAIAGSLNGTLLTAADLAAAHAGAAARTPTVVPGGYNTAEYVATGFGTSGNPQATAGIPLARVEALLSAMSTARTRMLDTNAPRDQREQAGDVARGDLPGNMVTAAANVARVAAQSAVPLSAGLRSLLGLVAGYLLSGRRNPNQQYYKGIAPIMARTNFVTMFGLLSTQEQDQLSEDDGKAFVDLALACADMAAADAAGPVLATVAGATPAIRVPFGEVTREVWLSGITQGTDVLSQTGYAATFQNGPNNPTQFESMGSLGAQTDTVGGMPAPIVELRRLRQNLPSHDWAPVLLGVFDLIKAVNTTQNPNPTYQRG